METICFNSGQRIPYSTAMLVYCSETMSITDTFDMHIILLVLYHRYGLPIELVQKYIFINDR